MRKTEQGDERLPNPLLNKKSRAVFLTILAGILWGTSFPIIKIGLTYIDPYAFVFWRFLFATLTLLIAMLLFKKIKFKMRNKKLLVFLGIANAADYLLSICRHELYDRCQGSALHQSNTIWVAILSPKLLGESFSKKKIPGVELLMQ